MLPTPSTSHVNYERVYEPREDSFLVLDALSSASEIAFLHERFAKTPPPLVAEIGTGSGVVLAFLTAHAEIILGRRDVLTLGVDISAFACQATNATVQGAIAEQKTLATRSHGVFLDVANGDLATVLRQKQVDILVFNPPYWPDDLPNLENHASYNDTSKPTSDEQEGHLQRLAWAGGEDGMEITNKLLPEIPGLLSERGVAYILLCRENNPEEVMQRIRGWGQEWVVDKISSSGKTLRIEKLCIIRISRVL